MAAEAVRCFRRALRIDPASGNASLGLALALSRFPADLQHAEQALHTALDRTDSDIPRWRLLTTLAGFLLKHGDAAQRPELYTEALAHAQEAIAIAADEAEPFFLAGIAQRRISEATPDITGHLLQRRKAIKYLRDCLRLQPGHVDANRSLQILEKDLRTAYASRIASVTLTVISTAILAVLWTAFFLSTRITGAMLTTLTPVMAGLIAIGLVLPILTRVKLPGGVEADISATARYVSQGPTSEDVNLTPGRFTVTTGAQGKITRRDLAPRR